MMMLSRHVLLRKIPLSWVKPDAQKRMLMSQTSFSDPRSHPRFPGIYLYPSCRMMLASSFLQRHYMSLELSLIISFRLSSFSSSATNDTTTEQDAFPSTIASSHAGAEKQFSQQKILTVAEVDELLRSMNPTTRIQNHII